MKFKIQFISPQQDFTLILTRCSPTATNEDENYFNNKNMFFYHFILVNQAGKCRPVDVMLAWEGFYG